MKEFVAIDFEYASDNKGTVCSVGIVTFKDGEIKDEFFSLIKPPSNEYGKYQMQKHKITPSDTINSPLFSEVYPEIKKRISGKEVVAHGAFHTDKPCLEQAMKMSGIVDELNISWQCTQTICGAGLEVVCMVCDIELNHHQALSDAYCAGLVYLKYLNDELPLHSIIVAKQNYKTKKSKQGYPENLQGEILKKPDLTLIENTTNLFYDKKVVVSGFSTDDKKQIASHLKSLGADIDSNVAKNTNFLIAGNNVGWAKLEKMEGKIKNGDEARIIYFDEYKEIMSKL